MVRDENGRIELLRRGMAAAAEDGPPVASDAGDLRFELLEEIGSGSAGRVYRAHDSRLQRVVALKLLRGDDPVMTAQFLREARAQARVEHENVARIFDAGQWNGKPFIAMQYIPGLPLQEAAREMPLEQKALAIARVAGAIHAAHRMGIIHRDLKPANILLERGESGWTPRVLDFGLARDQESAGGTRTGMIVGSPAYMSPEQARGDARSIDRRSDVYGLGASLYEALTGRPPFAGSGAEVLVRVLQDDPARPRSIDPRIPPDLEAVTLKCLEKAPRDRYDSARALQQDLERYLAGEPVLARRTAPGERILRAARKHRVLAVSAAVAAAVVLLLTGLWMRERATARERARLAQEFARESERIRGFLRYSATLPLHDVTPDRAEARADLQSLLQHVKAPDNPSYGPAHHAAGAVFLQLQDYELARRHLEMALESGYHSPDAEVALGQVLGRLYRAGLVQALRLPEPRRQQQKTRLEQQLRNPALRLLRREQATSASSYYVDGLISFYDGRHTRALQQCSLAIAQDPWMVEARKLEGDIHLESGLVKRRQEKFQEAMSHYAAAGAAYRKALDIARSDPELLLADCERCIQEMEVTAYIDRRFPEGSTRSLETCGLVLAADPGSAEAHYLISRIHYRVGDYQIQHGGNFADPLAAAIAAGERAVEIDPEEDRYYDFITAPLARLASYQRDHGLDPQETIARMIRYAEKASDSSQIVIGQLMLAETQLAAGRDPVPALEAAAVELENTARSIPDSPEIFNFRGSLLQLQAEHAWRTGRDPRVLLDSALSNFQRVSQLLPRYPLPYLHAAETHLLRAQYETNSGGDASRALDLALEQLQEALQKDPYFARAYECLGRVHLERARIVGDRGRSLADARSAFRRALEMNPDLAAARRALESLKP